MKELDKNLKSKSLSIQLKFVVYNFNCIVSKSIKFLNHVSVLRNFGYWFDIDHSSGCQEI